MMPWGIVLAVGAVWLWNRNKRAGSVTGNAPVSNARSLNAAQRVLRMDVSRLHLPAFSMSRGQSAGRKLSGGGGGMPGGGGGPGGGKQQFGG